MCIQHLPFSAHWAGEAGKKWEEDLGKEVNSVSVNKELGVCCPLWWRTPVISALWVEAESKELEVSLGYTGRPCHEERDGVEAEREEVEEEKKK